MILRLKINNQTKTDELEWHNSGKGFKNNYKWKQIIYVHVFFF